jgi:phosphate transport system protein
MKPEHSDKQYEGELQKLRGLISQMGAGVVDMIASSMRALVERDNALARQTIELDRRINRLEIETDDFCLGVLARRQPVASDLRFITTGLKLVTDLERIGDLCVNICERAIELNAEEPLKPYEDLPKMADSAGDMVREALQAFVTGDPERAQKVIARDRTVDAYYAQVFSEILTLMTRDPKTVYRATRIQSVAKYLERIGDHATNLAEMVVFLVKGKDIRHLGGSEKTETPVPHGVLFLCVRNAARSQMAEGWARTLLPPSVRIWSAGSQPAEEVDPYAVRVMNEVAIDISRQRPKRISDVPLGDVDTVLTLCAEEVCVALSGDMRRETWGLPDPAAVSSSESERLDAFRSTRDELRLRLQAFVAGDDQEKRP